MKPFLCVFAACVALVLGCGQTPRSRGQHVDPVNQTVVNTTSPAHSAPTIATVSLPPTSRALPTVPQERDATVSVFEHGRVKRFKVGSETAVQLATALGRELQAGVRTQKQYFSDSKNIQDYVDRVKEGRGEGEANQEGIEVSYPNSTMRVGDSFYSRIFILQRVDLRESADYYHLSPQEASEAGSVPLLLGNKFYNRAVSTRPMPPEAGLKVAINTAYLRPSDEISLPGSSQADAERLAESARKFLEAIMLWGQFRQDRMVAQGYEHIARLFLTAELNARTPDLADLGLLLPRAEWDAVQVSFTTTISGDRGTTTNALNGTFYGEAHRTQCARLTLDRREGYWSISAVDTWKPGVNTMCRRLPRP